MHVWPKYIDYLMMSSTVCVTTLVSRCTLALKWAGITFRADKSISIVIIKKGLWIVPPFSVSSPTEPHDFTFFISYIHSRPVNILGRIIDGSIPDKNPLDELGKKLWMV